MENIKNAVKVSMKDVIIFYMTQIQSKSVLVSHIKDVVRYILSYTNVMATERFEDTLQSIFSVIVDYPTLFKLDANCVFMHIADSILFEKLASENTLPSNVQEAITSYFKEMNKTPMCYATVDVNQAEENETAIRTDISYIIWLCKILGDKNIIYTSDFKDTCITAKDIANLSLTSNLYNVLSKYYAINLIEPFMYQGFNSFVFMHRFNNVYMYIEVVRLEINSQVSYKLVKRAVTQDVPYFPDVALGVPSVHLEAKIERVEELKNRFKEARIMDISYDIIKDTLKEAYHKDED